MVSAWSQGKIEALSPTRGRRIEPILITLSLRGRTGKHPYSHGSEEFAYVLSGRVTLTLGPEEHVLRAGDAVSIARKSCASGRTGAPVVARLLIVPRAEAVPGRDQGRMTPSSALPSSCRPFLPGFVNPHLECRAP